jgi:hypothetical protein
MLKHSKPLAQALVEMRKHHVYSLAPSSEDEVTISYYFSKVSPKPQEEEQQQQQLLHS